MMGDDNKLQVTIKKDPETGEFVVVNIEDIHNKDIEGIQNDKN